MANINRQWKRYIAVGCSHGHLADKASLKAVLNFAERYKPHTRLHLGDYVDTAAFRSGAAGTKDETVSLDSDMSDGTLFLRQYRPDILFNGNHDIRLWENADHYQEIRAKCAKALILEIEASLPKKCLFIKKYDINQCHKLGDTTFLHGVMFSMNALEEHGEHFGKCVIAHLHTADRIKIRRHERPEAFCTGYLGDESLFHYASRRRNTTRWSQGFVYGEYSDTYCDVRLVEKPHDGPWRMP